MSLEEKYDLPLRATICLDPNETDYMNYLIMQYRHKEAVELGEKLLSYYQNPIIGLQSEEKSYLLNLLGIIYDETQRMTDAEEMYLSSLAIRSERRDGDPDEIAKDIAICYNGLGNLYIHTGRITEAIKIHRAALRIRKKLAERNPDKFEEYLAYTFANLGEAYGSYQAYKESAEFLILACDIFEKLASVKPDPYDEYLSQCYHGLGVTYTRLHRYDDAERQFISAMEIQLKQAENNPCIFDMRVAASYCEFGKMCLKAMNYKDAEEKLKAAQELYRKLVNRTPDAFEPELAGCYTSLGDLYRETERFAEAREMLIAAIRLYEKYKETNPAFVERITHAQKLLNSVTDSQSRERAFSQFTLEEKEITLLLMERMPQREIIRKLNISAIEVARRVNTVREKISGMARPDPEVEAVANDYRLTQREVDVYRGLLQGKSNTVISNDLILSPDTVRIHVRSLLKKLSVENRQDIADWFEKYKTKGKK